MSELRKLASVASFASYLTSIMELSPDAVTGKPDLQASLLVAIAEVKEYNRKRGRSPGRGLEKAPPQWIHHRTEVRVRKVAPDASGPKGVEDGRECLHLW
ncbi:hypothetical protein KSD_52450 [Ktedonobacter sp. SOSP1-85]|uniref:hypothetical protein n=1 Tax=Ktedonobacter sp. SOSP1-85 TaxID=2778367 RepID=UPI0019153A1D|nr:hypothetical protein [Ktedonobacter sp. SOSP1-85]GHO77474.1 hypothetical protein KSD_52450 [Ktedonobacter sp. SOSP1-85]